MELNIRSNGTKVTDEMREVIDRKMERVDKLVPNVVDAQLELRTEKPRSGIEQTTAQLTLRTKGNVLRAEVRDSEPSKAIDTAIDKLTTQARKFSDKRARNRRRVPAISEALAATAAVQLDDSGMPADTAPDYGALTEDGFENEDAILEDRVVRIKRFPMKPMHVDEAIEQLELIGHDFFLFLNAEEEQFNVLYRRRDGDYGLLIPS
ncbi:MAG: ribosome hibernation-promoting factor, HPF/YfiA family [Thermomicrobiales bacterium]